MKGFAVRFTGPVRWNKEVGWGYAILGMTDTLDKPTPELAEHKYNVTLTDLDIDSPPSANPAAWEEAPRLMRLVNAEGGKIVGNRLRGGTIELSDGPWLIENNEYRGTPPGTECTGIISVHRPHDLIVRNNRAKPVDPQGKTWRFLVLTNFGSGNRIENNTIEGVGERDDDKIPHKNQGELIADRVVHPQVRGEARRGFRRPPRRAASAGR